MTTTASSTGSPSVNTRSYAIVTGGYWAFTLTDGALRMLVLLHFNELGYSAVSIAFLFLLYEAMGVATNLLGGWVGARTGLNRTLTAGLALQIVALVALTLLQPSWATWLSVAYVMCAQALSGIAKDLTKMSSKSAVKFVAGTGDGALFRMVAVLTGSKNALKGVGFFVGAALLSWLGFDGALWSLAGLIAIALAAVLLLLDEEIGRSKKKPPLRSIFSKSDAINRLAIARFFLFASRDIWFVVALPVFLADQLDWSHEGVGGFLALWVIGYGMVQSIIDRLKPKVVVPHHYFVVEVTQRQSTLLPATNWLERQPRVRRLPAPEVAFAAAGLPDETEVWSFGEHIAFDTEAWRNQPDDG